MVNNEKQRKIDSLSNWNRHGFSQVFLERAPLEYLVEGLFVSQSLNIVYGAPGSLKTMLMQDIALRVASGRDVLPPKDSTGGLSSMQAPVIWVDFDMGVRRLEKRFVAMAKQLGIQNNGASLPPLFYFSMTDPQLNLRKRQHKVELTNLAKEAEAGLVVVDCLTSVSGGADENSVQMVPIMESLRFLADQCGACIVVLHHQKKGITKGREGDALRGHSSIEAALDLALHIKRTGKHIWINPTKFRDEEPDKMQAEFTFERNGVLHEMSSAGFYRVFLEASEELRREILKLLSTGPKNQTEICKSVTRKKQTVLSELDAMVNDGLIDLAIGLHNSRIYSLI